MQEIIQGFPKAKMQAKQFQREEEQLS